MLVFREKVFDDSIEGTDDVFTSASLDGLLGSADRLCLQAVVDSVSGSSPTLTVAMQHSPDGGSYFARSPVPEIDAFALDPGATNLAVGHHLPGDVAAGFGRLQLTLGGTSPSAHVEIWATGRNGALPFTPRTLPGLVTWLRADIGVTLTSGVAAWYDQSGAALFDAARQSTVPQNPAYTVSNPAYGGRPTLDFSLPAESTLTTAAFPYVLTSPGTVIAVAHDPDTSTATFIVDGIDPAFRWSVYDYLGQVAGAVGGAQLTSGSSMAAPSIISMTFDGASSTLRVNGNVGQVAGDTGSGSVSGWTIGAGYRIGFSLNGSIAELLVFDRALSIQETRLIEAYLSALYRIPIT